MMITTEPNIPIPDPLKCKYPFRRLKVGDSFFVPRPVNPMSIRVSAYQYGHRHKMKFVTRLVIENTVIGVRVWRTK